MLQMSANFASYPDFPSNISGAKKPFAGGGRERIDDQAGVREDNEERRGAWFRHRSSF
jgi:hypothetical protein